MSDPANGETAPAVADDLRLVPVATAVWLTLLLATAGLPWALVAAIVVGFAAGLVVVGRRLRRRVLLACALAVPAAAAVVGVRTYALHSSPVYEAAQQRSVARVELVTTGDARLYGLQGPAWSRSVHVPAEVRRVTLSGDWAVRAPVEVVVSGALAGVWLDRPAGVHIAATVRFAPADTGSGRAALVRIRGPSTVVAGPSAAWRATNRVRAGLRAAVADRQPDQRALVPALVVGDTSAMTPDLNKAFRRTALTHLSAVSGANLALMLAFVLTVARGVGVRGWWLRLLGAAGVVVFVGICRTEPSVLRAAAMGLVALAGLGADTSPTGRGGRLRRGFRTLSVATILLLLVNPWLCRSAGFALSALATAGIVRWGRPWARALGRWLPAWTAEAVAVPLAAQVATQPVVTAISGQVSLVGIVANALAGPLVGPATVLGFAAAGASLVFLPAATVLGFAAGWVTQPIVWIARAGAALPGAVLPLPTTPVIIALIAAGCGLLAWLLPSALRRPVLVLGVTIVLVVALARVPPQPGWPPRGWFLVACDVGQGDGLVLRAGNGSAVVVDTGPDPDAMEQCLGRLGVRTVPLLVLSHFHADHVGGLSGVLDGRRVGLVLTSSLASPPAEAARTARLLAAHPEITVRPARVGERLTVGDLTWHTLGPTAPPRADEDAGEAQSSIENDSSIVGMVTARVGGRTVRILLPGDAEPPEQQDLLGAEVDLHADILKVPHHGSSRQDQDFLAATGARIAIASAGEHNVYGHPAPSTVRRLRTLGMTVLHTDTEGGIAVWCRAGRLGAVTQTRR